MKKCRNAATSLVSVLALSGCAAPERPSPSAGVFAEAIPICALLANPGPHVGKRVLVRGYLTRHPHGREFRDDDCERGTLPLNFFQDWPAESDRARRLRRRYQRYDARLHGPPWVPAVYAGVVKDHSPALIAWADRLSLQDAELVALGRPIVGKRARRRDRQTPQAGGGSD